MKTGNWKLGDANAILRPESFTHYLLLALVSFGHRAGVDVDSAPDDMWTLKHFDRHVSFF